MANPPLPQSVEVMVQEALATLSVPLRDLAETSLQLPAREIAAFFIRFRWRGRDGFRAQCLRLQGSPRPYLGCWCLRCFLDYCTLWCDLDVLQPHPVLYIVTRMMTYHNYFPYVGMKLPSRVMYETMRRPFAVLLVKVKVGRMGDVDTTSFVSMNTPCHNLLLCIISLIFTPLFADINEVYPPPLGVFSSSDFVPSSLLGMHNYEVLQYHNLGQQGVDPYGQANQGQTGPSFSVGGDRAASDILAVSGDPAVGDVLAVNGGLVESDVAVGGVPAVGDVLGVNEDLVESDLAAPNVTAPSVDPAAPPAPASNPAAVSGGSVLMPNLAMGNVPAVLGSDLAVANVLAVTSELAIGSNRAVGNVLSVDANRVVGVDLAVGRRLVVGEDLAVGRNPARSNLAVAPRSNVGQVTAAPELDHRPTKRPKTTPSHLGR